MSDFITEYLEGHVLMEDIDDFVDEWHGKESHLSLHEFLGMTKFEYKLWVENPDALPYIIKAHKENRNITDILEEIDTQPHTALAISEKETAKLLQRLKSQGLVNRKNSD